MSKQITIIGAGKTGRGFLARLAAEKDVPVSFIDKDAALVQRLNEEGSYTVRFFGGGRQSLTIKNYTVSTWENADLSGSGTILVSVGAANLPDVGHALRQRLLPGKDCRIITCENAVGPAELLADAIGMDNVLVSEAAVFCTTIEDEGLSIASENYPYLPFDKDRLPDFDPEIPTLRPTAHFGDFLKRKIFTYNSASGVIAYMGWLYGYKVYGEAANDPRIQELLTRHYEAVNRALCREFGYDPADQQEFAALSRAKFCNREIVDTIERNARQARRKLGRIERIFGPMELLRQYGEDTSVLQKTAAAAILYAGQIEKETETPEELIRAGAPWMDAGTREEILTYCHTFEKERRA
ncbi:MAG: hypothetical protein IJX90_06260 [Blautia sp.]|nr:hypothetical protein [Blautia sp.]